LEAKIKTKEMIGAYLNKRDLNLKILDNHVKQNFQGDQMDEKCEVTYSATWAFEVE
jgi:hypothetical protein